MNLRIFENANDLVHAAARTIVQFIAGRDSAAIALSGGSTPKPLYELLGGPMRDQLASCAITWVIVDERYVPLDDPQSNAAMIGRTLFANGMLPAHRFLRFKTELNDPARTALQFEEEWRALGIENLDLVLLGCGDDGHTASLFPGMPVLDVEDRIAVEVFVPKLDQWRVTLTKPVLRAASLRLVVAAGEPKAHILREVREGVEHPIALATRGVETWWLVDRGAAGFSPPSGAKAPKI
jgi:6-phosphogluconolactonase